MSRWHDPENAACACFNCTEDRYHAAVAARDAELEREDAELAERLEAELQLRLPMSPLPHVAQQSARFGRARAFQPELI